MDRSGAFDQAFTLGSLGAKRSKERAIFVSPSQTETAEDQQRVYCLELDTSFMSRMPICYCMRIKIQLGGKNRIV